MNKEIEVMSKKKTQVHWVNPSNPYHEAKLETWLYKAYEIANENYKNNPQTIFNDDVTR